VFSSTE